MSSHFHTLLLTDQELADLHAWLAERTLTPDSAWFERWCQQFLGGVDQLPLDDATRRIIQRAVRNQPQLFAAPDCTLMTFEAWCSALRSAWATWGTDAWKFVECWRIPGLGGMRRQQLLEAVGGGEVPPIVWRDGIL